ncbi:MAG: phosphoglucosamine mutase [Firmicutes bacterium]|nr:phosphoglucosamine mutase [Bacillota bacterium]
MTRLFGTDGVRGVANETLTPELAFKLGRAGAAVLTEGSSRPKVVIGRDPRISGQMLESALISGITSIGADVILLGVVTTPAVAYLTKYLKADAGVMISASHNPYYDNGIKFFSSSGFKLSDEVEDTIERLLDSQLLPRAKDDRIGRVYPYKEANSQYQDFLKSCIDFDLNGVHIAIDCANGSSSGVAIELLNSLGARVSVFNNNPNGLNINVKCGSTYPEAIQEYVQKVGADLGLTFDGDADRVLAVDEKGQLIDGDKILAICGLAMLREGTLKNKKIVATAYSNGGLIQVFKEHGGDVILAGAGDRYVLEAMQEHDLVLGGEQSGHIIFLEHSTTGDGLLTALMLLSVFKKSGKPLSELAEVMPEYPQILVNVRVSSKEGWEENPRIQQALGEAEKELGSQGRLFVRASGTEPLIRIMGEHPDKEVVEKVVDAVASVVRTEQGV